MSHKFNLIPTQCYIMRWIQFLLKEAQSEANKLISIVGLGSAHLFSETVPDLLKLLFHNPRVIFFLMSPAECSEQEQPGDAWKSPRVSQHIMTHSVCRKSSLQTEKSAADFWSNASNGAHRNFGVNIQRRNQTWWWTEEHVVCCDWSCSKQGLLLTTS